MTKDVELAVSEMIYQRLDYVQMSIDIQEEIIMLQDKGKCSTSELKLKVPADKPRYHLFAFKHTHEGDFMTSIGEISTSLTSSEEGELNQLIPVLPVLFSERVDYDDCG